MDTENIDWFVGTPLGIRTRVYFSDPSGAHPLTPQRVRDRYIADIPNSALVLWHLPESGIGGFRAGIDEVAWHDSDIAHFETWFWRPAKGSGSFTLYLSPRSGELVPLLGSDRYETDISDWHIAASALLERVYPGRTQIKDLGYDA